MGADQSRTSSAKFDDFPKTSSFKSNKRARSPVSGLSGAGGRIRRSSSATNKSELGSVGDWGFFEEFESRTPPTKYNGSSRDSRDDDFEEKKLIVRALSLPPPATQPPMYVLESTLQTQHLWYLTAGLRPKQPAQEREYFERLWRQNFDNSLVQYKEAEKDEKTMITSAPSSSSAGQLISPNTSALTFNQSSSQGPTNNKSGKSNVRDEIPYKEFNGEILYRGKGPFSNSVTRSFPEHDISGMTLQVPRFRIVRTIDGEVHAEFLVVISINSHHSFTFGLWKRHSDFHKLSVTVQAIETYGRNRDHNSGISFKNALLSWQCLIHRKRWFRCLDKDYLSLKCFLLERFMHDLLFESHNPVLISDFLGL